MKLSLLKYYLFLSVFFLGYSTSSAQILGWQFGNPASAGTEVTYTATTIDANLNTSALSRGAGIAPTGLGRAFSANNWTPAADKATAIANNDYYSFAVNAKAGYKFSLSTLDARLRRTGTGPNAYIWRYSIDGTNFNDIGTDISFTNTADGVTQTQIILSGITALQDVPAATTVTFRIYAWGAADVTGTFAIGRYGTGVTTNCLAIGGTVTSGGPLDPTTTSISPSSAIEGTGGFTLTVNGANFINGSSTVTWNGTDRTTSFVGATQLTAIIPATDITTAGTASVGVTTTGATNASNTQVFTINSASAPSLTLVSSLADFGNVCINTTTPENSFTLDGNNLNGTNISIAALPGFLFSETSGGVYTATLSFAAGASFTGKNVYVVFNPTAVQSYNGDLHISGGGIADYTVAATGSGINTSATISTAGSTAVTATSATTAGTITATGCSAITSYGIEYSTTAGFANGTGIQVASSNLSGNAFTANISGLSANNTYYYKAYVANGGSPAYGAQQSFTTLPSPVVMAVQPGLTYTEDFTAIATWGDNFSTGTGAEHFSSVAVAGTTPIPTATIITTASNTFKTGTSGGLQKGTTQSPSSTSIVLLATGSTDNTSSVAFDFYMDYTSVNAGTLSFNWQTVNNPAGDREGSLRVYASTNGTTFTELTGAAVLNISNGVAASGNVVVNLPSSFNNSPTARLRFYYYNGTGAGSGNRPKISIENITVTVNNAPVCTEPAAPPTALTLTPAVTSVSGSFTPNASATDEYIVLRSAFSTLTVTPADGTIYVQGEIIGNATVVSLGTSTSFTDAGLTAGTTYYYFAFAYNNEACAGGANYLSTSADQTVTTATPAPCTTPVSAATNLVLNAGLTSISGTFTASAGANRYLTVRSSNPTITFVPANGITYSSGQTFGSETIVAYSSATTFSSTGLTANTTYYFYVFSANGDCSGEPFYNTTSLDGSQTTLASGGGIPPGYYSSITTQTCSAIKTALFNIIKPTEANPAPDYSGICSVYATTDMRRSDDGLRDIIWDMYSDNPTGTDPYEFEYGVDVDGCGGIPNNPPIPGTSEGRMYNREHSFPRNWFGGQVEPMNSDIMHIFPTDKEVNAVRGNLPYGKVGTPDFISLNGSKTGLNSTTGFSGEVFEPIDEYKGDFARAQFYMITAYEDQVASWAPNKPEILDANTYPVFDLWYLTLMYQWNQNDPVSAKEVERNNAVFNIQGNRNPYVDHPEYLDAFMECTGALPVTLTSFTGNMRSKDAVLTWTAANESGFKSYEIQRSINGASFISIGEVEGKNLGAYNFTDIHVPQTNIVFYRLKMIDDNGRFTYSNIIAFKLAANFSNALVYPNPASGKLNVQLYDALRSESKVQITDVAGRLVKTLTAAAGEFNIPVNVNGLLPGRYFIKISNPDQVIIESFVVIK